jgi:hypothetical protein
MKTRSILFLVLSAVLLFSFTDCEDDEKSPTQPAEPDYAEATTPDLLVENFVKAQEDRNAEEYDTLLDESSVFYFAGEDVDLSPGQQGFWQRAAELDTAGRMFSGQTGTRPNGDSQPGVQQITLRLNDIDPEWTDASAEDPEFEGSLKRRYEVDMTVSFLSSDLLTHVTGEQDFYVIPVVLDEGLASERTVVRLRFWKDLGRPLGRTAAGTESTSWGEVKARFSHGPVQ